MSMGSGWASTTGFGGRPRFLASAFGFASAFFLYVFVNVAMVLGLLPIVGAPLPIMSYGGSSMLSIMLGLSIVMSCKIYNQEQIS